MTATVESDGSTVLDFEDFKEQYQKVPVEEYPNRVVETMPEPMVSVHVSTYQHADFIHDCMDGVLMQETDFPFEIIIGEDESDDGTREICKEYAEQHPEQIRLFLHRRENNIAVHGRPTGRFQSTYSKFVARGKYIAICEGDDYWTDPKKLQKQVGFLERNEEYVMSAHERQKVDPSGSTIAEPALADKSGKDEYSQFELMTISGLPTGSLCFRNVLENIPPEYVNSLNGDSFLIAILGEHGRAKVQREIGSYGYRIHEGGQWSGLDKEEQVDEGCNTILMMKKYFEKKDKKLVCKSLYKRYKLKREIRVNKCIENRNLGYALMEVLNLIKKYVLEGQYYAIMEFFIDTSKRPFCYAKKVYFSNILKISKEN